MDSEIEFLFSSVVVFLPPEGSKNVYIFNPKLLFADGGRQQELRTQSFPPSENTSKKPV